MRILNSSPLSFRFNVIKHGMVLFVRDDDERVVVSSLELPYMIYNIDKRKVMQW